MNSMSLPVEEQHLAWLHPFEVWQIDFEEVLVQEISIEVMRIIDMRRNDVSKGTTIDSSGSGDSR